MFLQDFMAKNQFFDIFTSFSLEHGPFFSTWWPSEEDAGKVIFLQKWPLPMLVQNVSGGRGILRAFCFFLMHLTIHPYSKLRKALSYGTIHIHFVSSATGQNQSEQSNFLFSCTVCTAVQAIKLALCVCLLKYSFSESKSAGFKL